MTDTDVRTDPAELGFDAARLERIGTHLRAYVDDGRLPGWSLLVSRHGQVAYRADHGHRDVEAGLPITDDTIFRIYSMTKPITSVATMMLVEQGRLELTDPVSRYIPSFADLRVHRGGSDLAAVTEPATEPVRVWHLLTHTAGLTYGFHRVHPVDAMYRAAGLEWGSPPGTDLAGLVDLFAGLPLVFQPGREWNYSVATDVLGRLVEVVSGQRLDDFFAEHIFAPLGMTDTTFRVEGARRDRLAALYTPDPVTGRARRNDAMGDAVLAPRYLSGGGGLASTLGDYHRFTQLLRGRGALGGVRLLGERTARYMTVNHLPGNADLDSFGRVLFAETSYAGVGFGLGFSVVLDPAATRTVCSPGEFGWGGAASTAFWIDPVEDVTVVFMTQLLPSSTHPIRSRLKGLVNQALVGP